MKSNLSFLLLLLSSFLICQNKSIEEEWILDKIVYEDSSPLEINHPDYSIFRNLIITKDKMILGEIEIPIVIKDKEILTPASKIEFNFNNGYLLMKSEFENKVNCYLTKQEFLLRYPESMPKDTIFNGKTAQLINFSNEPKLGKNLGLNEFITNFIKENFDKFINEDNNEKIEIEIKLLVSKNNKISDFEVIGNKNDKFISELKIYVYNAEKKINNTSGKDLFFNRKFSFQIAQDNKGNAEKIYDKIEKKYNENDFQSVIDIVEELQSKQNKKKLDGYYYGIMRLLGISYLILDKKEKACKCFDIIRKKELFGLDFSIRNYVINFCNK